MNSNNDLHVVFGTGPLGIAVMQELVRKEKTVRMINHSGNAIVPPQVEVIGADAYDTANTARLCENAAVVYQCAQPAYSDWPEKFPALQSSILEGAAANGARLVVGENLYMYGPVSGPIHEALPYNARGKKGTTRARMSEALLEAHQKGRIRLTIGRGSDFFGPNVTNSAAGEIIFNAAIRGKSASLLGNIDLPHTYTYIKDFGKALVLLGERDEALGQAWHIPNPETVTTRRFVQMVYESAGYPAKFIVAGRLLFRLLGLFNKDLREMQELEYEFIAPYRVDYSRFQNTFGLQATPLHQAIGETVAWYKERRP